MLLHLDAYNSPYFIKAGSVFVGGCQGSLRGSTSIICNCSISLYFNLLQIIPFNECIRMAFVIITFPPTTIISPRTEQTLIILKHQCSHIRVPWDKNLSHGIQVNMVVQKKWACDWNIAYSDLQKCRWGRHNGQCFLYPC